MVRIEFSLEFFQCFLNWSLHHEELINDHMFLKVLFDFQEKQIASSVKFLFQLALRDENIRINYFVNAIASEEKSKYSEIIQHPTDKNLVMSFNCLKLNVPKLNRSVRKYNIRWIELLNLTHRYYSMTTITCAAQ